MSDRVVVMNHGVIQQVGSPTDIYNEPVNAFVADFIGESNIIPGVMLEDWQGRVLRARTFECWTGSAGIRRSMSLSVRRISRRLRRDACFRALSSRSYSRAYTHEMMVYPVFHLYGAFHHGGVCRQDGRSVRHSV